METQDHCDCLNCLLQTKWREYYAATETALTANYPAYREILGLFDRICTRPVEIDEYWDMAVRLGKLLEQMGPGTVFYNYFFEQINPYHQGTARHFRHLCLDLREQIQAFDRWRREKRRLRLVKNH